MRTAASVLKTYARQEREIASRLSGYIYDRKSNYERPSFDLRDLNGSAWREMYAINPESRINFAALMFPEVSALAEEARRGLQCYHLTVVPEAFAFPLSKAMNFDPYQLRKLLQAEFPDVNMIGMIEASIFPRLEWEGERSPGAVSYHAHVLAWGPSATVMERRKDFFAGKHPCFVVALKSAHVVNLRPGALLGVSEYHYKSPANSYTVSTFERMDPTTGVFFDDMFTKVWKEKMSLKNRVRLYNSLERYRLPDLVIAQGAGGAIWKRVRASLPPPFDRHNIWRPVRH